MIDSLMNNEVLKNLNNKHHSILGRENDPKFISDISKFELNLRKISWELSTFLGLRFLTNIIYPKTTITHFDVSDAVALTIDDGFCGLNNYNGCLLDEVREILNNFDANATFFVTGSHVKNCNSKSINALILDGNEVANHSYMDWPYRKYTKNEFEFDLKLTESIIMSSVKNISKWYRAPFGKLTNDMQIVLEKNNLVHVIPDAFAHDTYIPDPSWISNYILRKVKPGSIILIHMPEKNLREWNIKSLELTLKGLKDLNLKILNLTQMETREKNIFQ
jgi:peptidoglycan/xylan/chitin deacetylase (PgdA/CDA1 family)